MEIGAKLKELRLQYGLTQEELAARCELTKGYISQLENDLTSPSIATLKDLLTVLGSNLHSFFSEEGEVKMVFTAADFFESEQNGSTITWVIPNCQQNRMEPILIELKEGASATPDMPHEGEEFGFVLQGRVRVCVGKARHSAKKGDAFYFKADKEHHLENIGAGPAKVLWVSTPPNF